MELSKTKKALIVSTLFFAIAVTLFVGGLKTLNTRSLELGELEQKNKAEKLSEEVLKNLELTLRSNIENIEAVKEFFIDPEEEADFIKKIEDLATTTVDSFEIKSFNHGEIAKNSKYEYAVLSATAEGSYSDVRWFLMMLEALPKEAIVDQFELQLLSTGESKEKRWRLSFVLKALKFKS